MRKFILIAAMVMASATAQAEVSRGLTVASNDEPAAVAQPKAAEASKPVDETPKYVERPAAVEPTTEPSKADAVKPVVDKDAQPLKGEKPKRRRESTEARVIYELHRHGIYW
jgi:hypothetical protein